MMVEDGKDEGLLGNCRQTEGGRAGGFGAVI